MPSGPWSWPRALRPGLPTPPNIFEHVYPFRFDGTCADLRALLRTSTSRVRILPGRQVTAGACPLLSLPTPLLVPSCLCTDVSGERTVPSLAASPGAGRFELILSCSRCCSWHRFAASSGTVRGDSGPPPVRCPFTVGNRSTVEQAFTPPGSWRCRALAREGFPLIPPGREHSAVGLPRVLRVTAGACSSHHIPSGEAFTVEFVVLVEWVPRPIPGAAVLSPGGCSPRFPHRARAPAPAARGKHTNQHWTIHALVPTVDPRRRRLISPRASKPTLGATATGCGSTERGPAQRTRVGRADISGRWECPRAPLGCLPSVMTMVEVRLRDGSAVAVSYPRVPPAPSIGPQRREEIAREWLVSLSQAPSPERVEALAPWVGRFAPQSPLGKIASQFVSGNRVPVHEDVIAEYLHRQAVSRRVPIAGSPRTQRHRCWR